MFNGAELEKVLTEYAIELGGEESRIKNPKNEHKNLRVFKADDKIFLVVHENSDPLVIDFFVHPEIQKRMIEQYDTASHSNLIDKKRAIQLVLTDQFTVEDLKSFIIQSYQLSSGV